jgi:predicted nucleotidyltransferase
MAVEILRGVVGSQAYGLATPGSDVDVMAVHVASTRDILGLSASKVTSATTHTTSPDFTSHELGKYCELALKANPTLLELLWLSSYDVATDAGLLLVDSREAFLSTRTVKAAYGGFALSEAQKIDRVAGRNGILATENAGRVEKRGRHAYRMLIQAQQLLASGELPVDVSSHRDEILAMGRMAVNTPREFSARVAGAVQRLDGAASILPDEPDRERVDELVRAIRTEQVRADLAAGI